MLYEFSVSKPKSHNRRTQGSILEPLLFLIYINVLSLISTKFYPIMYGDDSGFFLSGPSHDALILSANTELTKVYQWPIQNKLSLKIKKSKYMFFYKSRLKCEVTSQLQINNHTIERVRQFKFLRYQLYEKLSWNSHISMISSKVAKNIGLLSKLSKVLDSNTLRNLYFSIIHPYFSSGLHVWGNTNHIFNKP